MIVLSGSSNRSLAKKLAMALGVDLGGIELSRFANGEVRVFVEEKVSGEEVAVVQSFSIPPDEHLIEFLLICDAVKRLGAIRIIAVIPWLGYSKQDKVFRQGEPLSIKVIAKLLQIVDIDRLITVDLHNPSILGFFDIPVVNVSDRPLFSKYFAKYEKDNLVVVAPDAGAVKNSTDFARELRVAVSYLDKERDLVTGKVSVHGLSRDVKGCSVLMVDDMIETGSTLIESARFLKKRGAERIWVAATHQLFIPGVQRKLEASPIDFLLISDTVERPKRIKLVRTKVLSCAALLADAIKD